MYPFPFPHTAFPNSVSGDTQPLVAAHSRFSASHPVPCLLPSFTEDSATISPESFDKEYEVVHNALCTRGLWNSLLRFSEVRPKEEESAGVAWRKRQRSRV